MIELPIYITCHLKRAKNIQVDYTFKVASSSIYTHPYQLYRRGTDNAWVNLSVYAAIQDAVMVLLKELFSAELADEVNHGQATINPSEIMEKINRGDRSVFVYGSDYSEMCRMDIDVNFEDLIERKEH
jgi:hypothetical protein